MRFSEKQLLFGTIGIFVAAVLGLGGYGYYLYDGPWTTVKTQLQAVEAEIVDLRRKALELNQLRIELDKLKDEEEKFKRILPSADQVKFTAFVDTIRGFEKDSLVQVTAITRNQTPQGPTGPKSATTFVQTQYTLAVEGGFYEIAKFVYLLETHERFIKVENILFTPKQRSGQEKDKDLKTLVGATIVVSLYTF